MDQEKKTEKPKKVNKWILHTKKVQEANPDLSYKEVLTLAKGTYIPTKTKKESPKKIQEEIPKPELKREVTIEAPKQKVRKPRKPRKKKVSSDEENTE